MTRTVARAGMHTFLMVAVGLALALSFIASTLAQTGQAPRVGSGPGPAVAQPAAGNEVVPLFRKPFAGEWPLYVPFDHDLPWEFDTPERPKDSNGYILTWWGERTAGFDGHDGIDWLMPEGTPLLAVADGIVTRAREGDRFFGCPPDWWEQPSRGVYIRYSAPNGARYVTEYVHLGEIRVQEGQTVAAGEVIGLSGKSGCSMHLPHLHFSTYRQIADKYVRIDPYGWDGPAPDPWAQHPDGATSQWLWQPGQAPLIYREARQGPNPGANDRAAVAITAVQWLGWRDADHPNNEFVELTLDPRFAGGPSVDLSGFTLRNNAGEQMRFPEGFRIVQDGPVRIYAGPGQNTETELYWGRGGRAWDAMGDCAQLLRPDGRRMYRLWFGRPSPQC